MKNEHPEQTNDYIDENLQQEIDDALGGKSLEEIIDELQETKPALAKDKNGQIGRKISAGQIRTGKIVDVDPSGVLVELGGRTRELSRWNNLIHPQRPVSNLTSWSFVSSRTSSCGFSHGQGQ